MSIRHHYSRWTRRLVSIASVAWIVLLLVSAIAIRARATPPDNPVEKTRSFMLDSKSVSTAVDPSVAVGIKVKIVGSKNANGIKTLTVNPER